MLNIFVPEKPLKNHSKSNDWIANKVKNAIFKRYSLFQKWLSEPSNENHALYKICRNQVTKLVRDGKKEANQRQLGENPNPKYIYIYIYI